MIRVSRIFTAGMQDGDKDSGRQLGKSLAEDPRVLAKKMEYVKLYRACPVTINSFNDMDYCTLNLDFAKGHADHGAAVDEELYHVLAAVVPVSWVFEAYNPGEYFFHNKVGRPTKGKEVHVSTPDA